MQKDIGSKTKSSLIWNTSLNIGYQIFRFVIAIIIARILDPKDFGIMAFATMLVFYADSIAQFGFSQVLVQRKVISKEHINSVFTFNIIIALFFTMGTILASTRISKIFNTPELTNVLLFLSPIYIILNLYRMPITLLRREVNFKTIALANFYRGILQSFVTLTLAILGFKYWALVIGLVTSYAFGIPYILNKVKWTPKIIYSHNAMKEIFNFGMWNFIRAQVVSINEYAEKFIVGKFLGVAMLGFYEKAFSTISVQKQAFTMGFNKVMFASFSRIQSEQSDKVKKYFKKSLAISSLFSFPISMGFFILGTHFVLLLLGKKWEPMIVTLKIFSVAFIFSSINQLITSLNIALGDYKRHTIRIGFCALLLIIISLSVVRFGIEFVALGVLFVNSLNFLVIFKLAKENLCIYWVDLIHSLFPSVIGSLIMVLMILFCEHFFFQEINYVNFIILSGIGAISYLLAVFVPRYHILEELRKPIIISIERIFKKSIVVLNRGAK